MWRVLLDLLAAARRPLVVVDFETAGLGGKPPVEFAVLIWAPWREPEMDATTVSVRGQVPPGLTYACVQRLDPGMPIDHGATAVHKIRDEDVRGVPGVPMWNDLEVRMFFQGLASGDAAENEGPAIWCGHNAQGADLAWGRKWGYFPPAELDAVDTMRLVRRLQKEMPFPMFMEAVDPVGDETDVYIPAIAYGLDTFASSLDGAHVGLLGKRPENAHGALADCCSTSRVLARALNLWGPLWPPRRQDVPASANLSALLAALDAPPPGDVSWDGWLGPDETKVAGTGWVWRKGKHRGASAEADPSYRSWVMGLPRSPTGGDGEAWCSQHTADILQGLRPMAVAR